MNGASPPSCRARRGSRAARTPRACTNSSRRVAQAATFFQACGERSNRSKQTVSQMPQLSKSRHQRSICAGVTRAGSSTKASEHAGPRTSPYPRARRRARGRVPSGLATFWMLASRPRTPAARDAEAREVCEVLLGGAARRRGATVGGADAGFFDAAVRRGAAARFRCFACHGSGLGALRARFVEQRSRGVSKLICHALAHCRLHDSVPDRLRGVSRRHCQESCPRCRATNSVEIVSAAPSSRPRRTAPSRPGGSALRLSRNTPPIAMRSPFGPLQTVAVGAADAEIDFALDHLPATEDAEPAAEELRPWCWPRRRVRRRRNSRVTTISRSRGVVTCRSLQSHRFLSPPLRLRVRVAAAQARSPSSLRARRRGAETTLPRTPGSARATGSPRRAAAARAGAADAGRRGRAKSGRRARAP